MAKDDKHNPPYKKEDPNRGKPKDIPRKVGPVNDPKKK